VNLSKLGGAWMIHVTEGEAAGTMSGVPVVIDGIMYIGTSRGEVLAVNAATGAIIWRFKSTFGNRNNRGVAVAEGKVFSGAAGSRLIALDQKTGALLWETKVMETAAGSSTSKPGTSTLCIGTVAQCPDCEASDGWLGKYSPKPKISAGRLWQEQHLLGPQLSVEDLRELAAIRVTPQ
jgi:outer membrane protein assembly factor BamB